MNYWQKQEKPLFKDLEWNFPEQKQGTVSIVGGNGNSFSSVAKLADYLGKTYPVKKVETYLPDSLRKSLPLAPGLNFVKSTSGSIIKSDELDEAFQTSDFTLVAGDLSKNSATSLAISGAMKTATSPILLARDAVDCVAPEIGALIEDHDLIILASMAQLQKIFRTLLYPKMILLSAPLLPTIETLHKFTLSYEKATLITLHENHILVAARGKVTATPLEKTSYNALTFFTGTLPADLLAYNLWNPGKPLEASSAALYCKNPRS